MAAARRRERSARSQAMMVRTASRRRDRLARSKAMRVSVAAPIIWRKMKSILSHRRPLKDVKLREVAKQAKSRGLRSHRRMQGSLLPFEVVATILSRLPAKSLLRFRCVCKEWRSLTYYPNFIKEHQACARAPGRLALISRRNSAPDILLYDFGDNGEVRNQWFSMRFGDRNRYTMSNPVNGLVCIEYSNPYMCDDGSHYLMNPATRELAKLPTSGSGPSGVGTRLGLGFDSSTGGYKMVKLIYTGGQQCGCRVLELGTQEWREVGHAPCYIPGTEPVSLNGAIHWMVTTWTWPNGKVTFDERRIVAFNLKDENFRSVPFPSECRDLFDRVDIVEWEGLLCTVMIRDSSTSMTGGRCLLRIWRLEDYATCRWTEAHCSELPKYTSEDGFVSPVGIRGHEILLTLLRGRAPGSIWSYDLRTRSVREVYNEHPGGLQFLTESLVSPRYLVGNPSIH